MVFLMRHRHHPKDVTVSETPVPFPFHVYVPSTLQLVPTAGSKALRQHTARANIYHFAAIDYSLRDLQIIQSE